MIADSYEKEGNLRPPHRSEDEATAPKAKTAPTRSTATKKATSAAKRSSSTKSRPEEPAAQPGSGTLSADTQREVS